MLKTVSHCCTNLLTFPTIPGPVLAGAVAAVGAALEEGARGGFEFFALSELLLGCDKELLLFPLLWLLFPFKISVFAVLNDPRVGDDALCTLLILILPLLDVGVIILDAE